MMENTLSEDTTVGVYHTNDNIKNFKLRVRLRKIPNTCFTEKDSLSFNDSNECELVSLLKVSSVSVERIFSWQEPVFKKVRNDAKEEESAYDKKESLSLHLFSYTKNDFQNLPVSSEKKSSVTEKEIANMEPKIMLPASSVKTWQQPLFSNGRGILKESKPRKKKCIPIYHSMVIMAALFFDDSSNSEEIELCSMHLDNYGTLIVFPDFTRRRSYSFVNSRSETFEYELENVSKQLTKSSIQRGKHIMNELLMYKEKLKKKNLYTEIHQPLPGFTEFYLNIEIVSTRNFMSSDVFIHYLVDIPEKMKTESILEGVTQTCQCKSLNDVNVSYYGYLLPLNITVEDKDLKQDPLRIIFNATSIDSWGNFRNEGYGYANIMLIPGMLNLDVCTWKLEPTTLYHKLQNFFIGGIPHLEDLTFVISGGKKDSQLSKYGILSQSSGTISLKVQIIKQSTKKQDESLCLKKISLHDKTTMMTIAIF